MTAMLTQTETHLREIAEKIEEIYGICGRTPIADPSPAEAQEMIQRLAAIGQIVHSLPAGFRERHQKVDWTEMAGWSNPQALSPAAFNLDEVRDVVLILDNSEPEIKRHAFANKDIQAGVILSLDTRYEQISKDWSDSRRGTYILISLTALLAVVRGGLATIDDYELTSLQILIYCVLLLPILWVAFDIFWVRKIYRYYNYNAASYDTYTEFYVSASLLRLRNIGTLLGLLSKQRRLMIYQAMLWLAGVITSVIITLLKVQ